MDRHHIATVVFLSLMVGGNLSTVIAARRIAIKAKPATGASVAVALVLTCLLCYTIYAYYINDWAGLVLFPAVLLFGIPALIALVILAVKHCVNWKCLIWVLPICLLVWVALAKPYGIICRLAVRDARASFFIPADAIKVRLTPPGRYGSAVVCQEFYSQLSTDELLAFYSNKVTLAGFTVTGTRPNGMQVDGPFYPYHILTYRTAAGKYCNVWVFENVPYEGLEHTRSVRLEYCFNPAFGAPVVGF